MMCKDVCIDTALTSSFFVDSACGEYRYAGTGDFRMWETMTNGAVNVNDANTAYNISKGNNVSIYGRYGRTR